MSMERRVFIGGIAAVPVIYGLERVLGQETPAKPVDSPWFDEALKRMKATGRWGVVIVPPADADSCRTLGHHLYKMTELDDEDAEAHEIFCQAVFVILPASAVKAKFPQAEGKTRLLLDADGSLIDADKAGLELYTDSKSFAAFFRHFIHGKDDANLVRRAGAIEAGLSDELRKAGNELDATDDGMRAQAVLTLSRNIEPLTPWLAWLARDGATEEIQKQAKLLLLRYFTTLPKESVGSRLPYGTYLPQFGSSCGRAVPLNDEISVACGIGGFCKRSGKFVSFLPKR